jgi:hypothetical protein
MGGKLQRYTQNERLHQINVLMAAAAFNFRKWMRLFLLHPKMASFWSGIRGLFIKPAHHSHVVMTS